MRARFRGILEATRRNFAAPAGVLPRRPLASRANSPRRRSGVQRGGHDRGVVASLREHAPHFDVLVVDDGSTDDTARARRARPARASCGRRSTSASAARCRPGSSSRSSTATTAWSRSTATASTTRRARQAARARWPSPASTWSAARASSPTGRVPGAGQPPHRHPHLRLRCCRASSASGVTDPTSGFRLYNRRAIALFADDYPHDYPEVEAVLMLHHHRLRMREVPVRMFERGGGSLVDQLGQVGLLHGQGAAGAVRRARPPAPGRRARRRARPVAASHGI